MAIDTFFKFSIDNHTMTVIAMDFVPIEPFETTILSMGNGMLKEVLNLNIARLTFPKLNDTT